MNPYVSYLWNLLRKELIIHRADASELKGVLVDIKEDGCIVSQETDDPDRMLNVFVAFSDIRGIGTEITT